jgi:hypothetical protein
MAAAQSLVKPEVLEEAKRIIEVMPKLKEINGKKLPPDIEGLGMTHLARQLVQHIKDVRDPETLLRILPAQLRQAYYHTQACFPNDLLLEILEFEEENNKFKRIIMRLKEDLSTVQLNNS